VEILARVEAGEARSHQRDGRRVSRRDRVTCTTFLFQIYDLLTLDALSYHESKSPWDLDIKADVALPSATQNEVFLF
jgi:hypothetical protein